MDHIELDKDTITKAYARWAPVYDLVFGSVFESGRAAAISAAERVGGRILEVGVGTGISLPDYKRTTQLCGVDISAPMLQKAAERVRELGLTNVEGLFVMDAEKLEFPDASFDVVMAQYVVTTVPHPEATLDEFARVLKPGGQIILVSRVGAELGLRRSLEKWFAPAARKLGWRTEFPFERYTAWVEGNGTVHLRPRGAAVRPLLVDSIRKERRRGSGECAEERGRLKLQQDLCEMPPSIFLSHRLHRITIAVVDGFITGDSMERFLDVLRTQRWDDHRYYHHSRINQSLHLVSAISFLFSYVMIFKDPAMAALVGWLLGMTTRQIGHFFFEPHTYDKVNQASHEHKESIKVGYNLQRKVVLLSIWALSPLPLLVDPSYFGVFTPHTNANEFVRHVAQIWLAIGLGGVVFRVVQLMVIKDVETGLVWAAKIITDPFHDIKIYWSAPYHLLRGELIDPNIGEAWVEEEAEELPRAS